MGTTSDKDRAAKRVEIAERIEEAWDVLKRMPDRERSALLQAERGQVWPLMVYSADEHAAWQAQPIKRPPPSAKQISRMEEVMDWLLVLAKQERKFFKAVWLFCALGKRQAEVKKILGCDRHTATIWRDAGLDRIARHLEVSGTESLALRDSLMQGMHHPKRAYG